jgi:hypothetical protein
MHAYEGRVDVDEVLDHLKAFERRTQPATEEGMMALRKTYGMIVAWREPPETEAPEAPDAPELAPATDETGPSTGTAWQNLGPLEVDDEGNAFGEGRPAGEVTTAPAPAPASSVGSGRLHHFVVVARFGPHRITSKVLRRENLTPFGQGCGPRPERSIPSGWHANAATRVPWAPPSPGYDDANQGDDDDDDGRYF